ncbi:19253_t:CDS:2 [Gigaspora rosea]|nr:19253_t:CDS:2 [Gigaspora rosea]
MPPKTRKVQKKKEMAEVLSLQTELSSACEEITILITFLCTKKYAPEIWVKYGDVLKPTRFFFEGKVDNLKRKIKEELPNHFGDVDVIQIALKRHDGEMNLREDFIIDQKFLTIYDTLLQVIVNAPVTCPKLKHENIDSKHEINDTIKKVIAQQKIVDKISVSNLFEMKIRESLNKIEVKEIMMVEEDFEKLNPISYLLFECGEKIEAQQMEEVAKWFDDALKLPQGLNIWNIHTDVNYQREIKSANVLLTSGSDIAIGPSRTTCVWVEAKKSTAECEIGQVIGELLLIDNRFALNSMTVLTNCNNFWMILYIIKDDDVNYIVRCSVNCGLALAIIKQFVIEVENQMNKWVGKSSTYTSGDAIGPFKLKAKLDEHVTEELMK